MDSFAQIQTILCFFGPNWLVTATNWFWQYFTLPLLVQQTLLDFCQTLLFPMDSADCLLESVGHDWILLLVQAKSSESPLKPLRNKKWLDWPEFCVCWTSAGLFPMDRGRNQSYLLSSQSDGLLMDF